MSKTMTGKDWTHSIFFYQNVDDKEIKPIIISDKKLIQEMSKQVDVDEKILHVYTYKSALAEFLPTKIKFFHQFVVFKTERWWWSIEKDGNGIVIQRSKTRNAVQDKNMHSFESNKPYNYVDRKQLERMKLMKESKGAITVRQLLNGMWVEDELNQRYHLLDKNCQHFANAVFDFISGQVTIPVSIGQALLKKREETIIKIKELADQIESINKKGKIAKLAGTSATILGLAVGVPAGIVGIVATGGILLPVALAGYGIGIAVTTAGSVTRSGALIGSYKHMQTKYDEAMAAIYADRAKSQQFLDGIGIDEITRAGWIATEMDDHSKDCTTESVGKLSIVADVVEVIFPVFDLIRTSIEVHRDESHERAEQIREFARKLEQELPHLEKVINQVK